MYYILLFLKFLDQIWPKSVVVLCNLKNLKQCIFICGADINVPKAQPEATPFYVCDLLFVRMQCSLLEEEFMVESYTSRKSYSEISFKCYDRFSRASLSPQSAI